jgi:hypothetical protein
MRLHEFVLGLALFAACGGDKPDATKDDDEGYDHADHVAPHGGEILDLGGGAAHLEVIHDHDGGNITVFVLGADLKTPIAVEAPVVSLEKGPVQFTLTAVEPGTGGKASVFKGSHEGLKSDPWEGRIRVKIGDKTYQSPLEGEAHDHK